MYCQRKSVRVCWALVIAFAILFSVPTMAASKHTKIRIGTPPWPGVTIKSTVVAEILRPLGYTIEFYNASAPLVYHGLGAGTVDINMSAWSPGQAPTFMPLVRSGKVMKVGQNLTGATSGFAVPSYVYEAGLHNAKQLSEYAQKLDKTIYCIDPGSGANAVVKKAIKNNIYGLGDWTMIPSSAAIMLTQVQAVTRNRKWLVFCGWKPHWMNISFDIRYLKDPKNLWGPGGGKSRVWTLVTDSFPKTNPTVTKFLKRFQVTSEVQSNWIYNFSYKEKPAQSVADNWIASHLKQVTAWLEGLKTVNGQSAVKAIKARYGDIQ